MPQKRWGFDPESGGVNIYFTYSNEKYELSVFPSGEFFGTPEEAFDTAARVYLSGSM